jgi:transposase-like protein
MAKKGQKFKKYCPELKENILREYFLGEESPTSLSSKYDIPVETVWTWSYCLFPF